MLDRQFIQAIIGDIITKGDYTLEGIARYTGLHEDLIYDAAAGMNATPSVSLFHRLVTLHKTVRPELYESLRNTMINQPLAAHNQTAARENDTEQSNLTAPKYKYTGRTGI